MSEAYPGARRMSQSTLMESADQISHTWIIGCTSLYSDYFITVRWSGNLTEKCNGMISLDRSQHTQAHVHTWTSTRKGTDTDTDRHTRTHAHKHIFYMSNDSLPRTLEFIQPFSCLIVVHNYSSSVHLFLYPSLKCFQNVLKSRQMWMSSLKSCQGVHRISGEDLPKGGSAARRRMSSKLSKADELSREELRKAGWAPRRRAVRKWVSS